MLKMWRFLGYFAIYLVLSNIALASDESLLPPEYFASFGYNVKSVSSEKISEWEDSTFNLIEKTVLVIKSIHQVPDWKNAYYRYVVRIEKYPTDSAAVFRLNHLLDKPPQWHGAKEKIFPLQKGFVFQNRVYILSTDVYKFFIEKEFERVKTALARLVIPETALE